MVRIQALSPPPPQISQGGTHMQGRTGCFNRGHQQPWMGWSWSKQDRNIPITSLRPDLAAGFEFKWSPGWWARVCGWGSQLRPLRAITAYMCPQGPDTRMCFGLNWI